MKLTKLHFLQPLSTVRDVLASKYKSPQRVGFMNNEMFRKILNKKEKKRKEKYEN